MIPPSITRNTRDGQTLSTFAGKVRVALVAAGELSLPSGILLAGDPQFLKDARPFEMRLVPGSYPLFLTIAHYADKDQRIAAAQIQVAGAEPREWAPANPPAYGIDSGFGCYVDFEAARRLTRQPDAAQKRYWSSLNTALNRNYADTRSWAGMTVDQQTGANLIAFSSGFGDGGGGCYAGLDARGRLCRIMTDFELLLTPDEVAEMEFDDEDQVP